MPKIPRPEPWQHRFVEANGLRFHVVTAEPTGGGPSRGLVLLLHGFPEFWYSWRRQIPALASAGFDVAAPDLRGYNDSDKPDGIEAYGITYLPGVSHWVQQEAPAKVNALLIRFLDARFPNGGPRP
jgi:pimeloyl-ACP methyl ester carboxylesterase